MGNKRFATRGNSLIGDTIINYNLPIPMNSSTSNHPTNSRDMKNMVYHKPFPNAGESMSIMKKFQTGKLRS